MAHRRSNLIRSSDENKYPSSGEFLSSPDSHIHPQPLLEKVRTVFSWITSWISQEAETKVSSDVNPPQNPRTVSVHFPHSLAQRAERSIHYVEQTALDLIATSGQPAQAFVERFVDPIVVPARQVLAAAKRGESAELTTGAVTGVELISLVYDQSRIFRKIRDICIDKMREAILEDIGFLKFYPTEAISGRWISRARQREVLEEIQNDLEPILDELEQLFLKHPTSNEMRIIFQWKCAIDVERQRLHDAAIDVIEGHIRRAIPAWEALDSANEHTIDPFLQELELFANEGPPWPLSILELEETAGRLRELLEAEIAHADDGRVRSFFHRMRKHYDVLVTSGEGEEHGEIFDKFQDEIQRIEVLLGLEEINNDMF